MSRRIGLAAILLTLSFTARSAWAAPPALVGKVTGIELLPQSLFGSALFIFEYKGTVDGKSRSGLGWISVNHEPLPDSLGETAAITGGEGAILVGLTRVRVDVNGGLLTLTDLKDSARFDDEFAVQLNVDLSRRGETATHVFSGALDHEPFPPTIEGSLGP